jgi:hypothetical protein
VAAKNMGDGVEQQICADVDPQELQSMEENVVRNFV